MVHPQALAMKLVSSFKNKELKAIAEYGCCAFSLLWYLGIDQSDLDAVITVRDLIHLGAIDVDCTVKWDACCRALTGKGCTVDFVKINKIDDIKGRSIVKFTRQNKIGAPVSHWVGVENGKVAFNSLKVSRCVTEGVPTDMRLVWLEGVGRI